MLTRESLKFLSDFMNASSPSGFEEEAAGVFRSYVSGFCAEVRTDVLGNTMGILNPGAPLRVMLAGHYDEIGFQIVYISDEGLLYFRPNGGIDKLNVPSTEVEVLTANGRVHGVIGKKPIHLLKASERDVPPELSDMWIDIGAADRKEAESLVSIGDPVAVCPNFRMLNEHRFISKGTDDKVGAFVVAETLRELSKRKLNVAVYGVGTVQEEVGCRGAAAAAFTVAPQAAIAVEATTASDIHGVPEDQRVCSLGGGAVVSFMDGGTVYDRAYYQAALELAGQRGIAAQPKQAVAGGNNASAIHKSRGGVRTLALSLPCRYIHSGLCVADQRDIQSLYDLTTAVAGQIASGAWA